VAERHWDDDDALLADLAEAVAALDGREQTIASLGRGAYAWRTVDDDLLMASLSYDSVVEPALNMRSNSNDTGPRTMVFTSAPLAVELEVMGGRALGQLSPATPGTVVIESADGTSLTVEVDELGFFEAEPLPAGPVRIRCDTEVAKLVTDWVQL
jgi:hypothetical protein